MSLLRSFPAAAFALVLVSIVAFCVATESFGLLVLGGALAAMSWYVTEGPRGRTLPRLAGGSSRATLQVHPDDARAAGVGDGDRAHLRSGTGDIQVVIEATDTVMPGVVCLPHGWAPDSPDTWDDEATSGPNINVLTPGHGMDPLTGTAVLNAVPVQLLPT